MKLHRYDLEDAENPYIELSEELEVDEAHKKHDRYLDIFDIYVEGSGFYDDKTTELIVGLEIEATVVVPCAISLVPIEIDIEARVSESFVFDEDGLVDDEESNSIWVEGLEIDLRPFIWSAIMSEIPLKVIDPELETYPTGEGWSVLSEADYQKEKEDEVDPRLAKLKDFKFD